MDHVTRIKQKEDDAGALGMLSYCIIFATAIFGLLHGSWWYAVLGAALLTATLTLQDMKVTGRLVASQAIELAAFAGLSRLSLCMMAGLSAFGFGRVSAWIFGL